MRSSLWRSPALLLATATSLVSAVYPDEVGDIDYHHELVGVPQIETTFFHRPKKDDRASLLYTLSDVGVLGAINPGNGGVKWRQFLTGNVTNGGGHLRAADGENWVTSAYGSSVHGWNALTGRNTWSLDFAGEVRDLEVMELTENGRKDVLVLSEEEDGSSVLRRIHGQEGWVVWEVRDNVRDVPLQVSNNIEKIFVVSLSGSPTSYSIRVTIHDTLTGKRIDELTISTKGEVSGKEDVLLVGSNSASPIVAWTDKTYSKLRVNVLGTKSKQELVLPADTVDVAIHAPHHVQAEPHFLVHSRTATGNKGDVYHINLKNNAITKAYELPLVPGLGAFSTSSEDANVYFTRVTEDEISLTSSESDTVLAKWPYKAQGTRAQVLHGVSEVVKKGGDAYAIRSATVSTEDDWVLVRNGEQAWSRPEGLSGAVAASFAEIPEDEELAKTLELEAHSNILSAYIHRVHRHLKDLEHLPDYLAAIPERFLSSITGSEAPSHKAGLSRDSFGFNKLAVIVTRRGRAYGLDVGNHGKVIWSTKVYDIPAGESWDVKGVFVEDHRSMVTIRGAQGEQAVLSTVTGQLIEASPPGSWPPLQAAAVADSASGRWLVPVGLGGKVGDIPAAWKPKQTVIVRGEQGELKGLRWVGKEGSAKEVVSWIFTPPAGQTIVEVATRAAHDPIAQLGRVLSDRTVKYKYLNPNTAVVAAHSPTDATLTIYLLDTVSGSILSSATHHGVDSTKTIDCTVAENWFACTFFGEYTPRDGNGLPQSGQALKGYQIIVSDLFESDDVNDRGPLGDAEKFSSIEPIDDPTGIPIPSVISQAWILAGPIDRLAVTQTRQGITVRQVLAYLPEAHGIIGIPRQVLEPRRTVGRDPTPGEMEAEALLKYVPVIELDPRQAISHVRNVFGVQEILATPATLESTSIILAYGVDVFGSRVAPSLSFDVLGKGFDKITLLGTVLALTVGVMALKPIVRAKQTDQRWKR
ncbi:hypothetical protein F5X68DRAFT_13131 [Plectosphaerella plurivora]|uniref:ER membrane protein complex subunit 1 n=1 Tax=Plectosphaerella plurivora TaxID=936078 RepID=A0A9P8VD58_9PEZI|nr:hypothetical protein F5X68DRAFT_13131 [Plectosphaerella plurivora]